MDVTEQDRLLLRQQLTDVIGASSCAVLMEALPPLDYRDLATRNDLDLTGRELRSGMAELRTELRGEMAELRTELRGEMAELRAEMHLTMARHLRLTVLSHIATTLALAGLLIGLG